MARVGLIGGSFNPPHVAHGMMVYWLLSTRRVDEVWLVPCYRHPLGKDLAPFEHRHQMCQLICQQFLPDMVVSSRVEADLGGESRTLYTIQHLLHELPEHQFHLVVGSDILQEKAEWYRYDEIERLVPILVVGREGYPLPEDAVVLPNISSSSIRRKLQRGEDVSALVPAAVLDHIQMHGLYRAT